jgi:hypothetical protein
VVADFIDREIRHRVEAGAASSPPTAVAVGLLLRAIGWLRTAAKLNEPGDFQAVAAGARAMFETALDLALLHFDKQRYPVEKMIAWQQSAKLHDALAVARYVANRPAAQKGTEVIVDFAQRNGAAIEVERAKHWPPKPGKKTHHPQRWTGRNLDQDALEADKLADRGFTDFYEHRYRRICWNVHGSGLAGVAGLDKDTFPALTVFAFDSIGHFALVTAEMALRLVGGWDAEAEIAFGECSKARRIAIALHFHNHPARQEPPVGPPSK